MGRLIRGYSALPVASGIIESGANNYIRSVVVDRRCRAVRQPVLHVGVVVAKLVSRKARDRIVQVGNAVLVALLCGDELNKGHVANAR